MAEKSVFEKIMSGDIPAEKLYDDERCIAIRDINPQAPTHVLVIPRQRLVRLSEAQPEEGALLGHLLLVARQIAKELKLDRGFRIVINNGPDGGESVPHLHVHLLGGRAMTWPPG